MLLVQAAVFALSSAVFIGCAELGAPFWTLLMTGILAGASMPSVGTMVRTRWSTLVDGDERRLHTAFALESVNDELIFVIGPALVTLLATQFIPASGIAAASLLCVGGTVLFAAAATDRAGAQAATSTAGSGQRAARDGRRADRQGPAARGRPGDAGPGLPADRRDVLARSTSARSPSPPSSGTGRWRA